ncbi:NAD(P)-binding domain-containing protein [Inquilinus limosus]|uniref:NADPH-dependent F420 reductase n=1 Tax=Inquilinus limosus TaxID=171674 RepID=UPI003F1896F8
MKIGFIGAGEMTGVLGRRLVLLGHEVLIGSRSPDKAREVAAAVGAGRAGSYDDAAAFGEVVFVALHNNAVLPVLAGVAPGLLTGKILVDCNNPVDPPDFENRYGSAGSLAEDIARAVPTARVVKAFNTIYAELIERDMPLPGGAPINLFIAGDDPAAKSAIDAIGRQLGYTVVDAGGLRKARHLENLAAFEIDIVFGRGFAPYVALILSAGRTVGQVVDDAATPETG